MAELTKGRKVLVKKLSLSYSDYKNLPGVVVDIHGEYASVAVPGKMFSVEDQRDLKHLDGNALISVKLSNLAKNG
jgi:hypothetical protein